MKNNNDDYDNNNNEYHQINERQNDINEEKKNMNNNKQQNMNQNMHDQNNDVPIDNDNNNKDIDQIVEYEINDLSKSNIEIDLKEKMIKNKDKQHTNINNTNHNNNENEPNEKDMSHLEDKINNIFQGESNKQKLEKTVTLHFESEYESTDIHQHQHLNNNKLPQPLTNINPPINNDNANLHPQNACKQVSPTEIHVLTLWVKKCNEKLSIALTYYSEGDYKNAYICFKKISILYKYLLKQIQEKKDVLPSKFIGVLENKIQLRIYKIDKFIVKTYQSLCKQQQFGSVIQHKQLPQVNKQKIAYNKINILNINKNNNKDNNKDNHNKQKAPSHKGTSNKEEDEMEAKIENEIMLSKPNVKFSDIIGMNNLKQIIYEIIIMPNVRPDLFTGLRQPQRGLLLFGPPGTGKTMIAKAIANECESTFFNISASSLTSKWVGESERTVRSLFKLAYKKQPSIIFIDEIDSVLSKRSDNDNEAAKRLKTEFLIQFDGLGSNKDAKLLVIAATNRPMDLDDALLRRLPKRVYCGPLDEEGRFHYVKKLLNKIEYDIKDEEIRMIAAQTERYSNSDLLELCREAAYEPVREKTTEEILKIDKFRPIVFKDFEKAMNVIRGTISPEANAEMDKWNETFGTL